MFFFPAITSLTSTKSSSDELKNRHPIQPNFRCRQAKETIRKMLAESSSTPSIDAEPRRFHDGTAMVRWFHHFTILGMTQKSAWWNGHRNRWFTYGEMVKLDIDNGEMVKFQIENGHRNSWLTYEKKYGWWFGTLILFSISYMGCHPEAIDELHDFPEG